MSPDYSGVFFTGTDSGVGKTQVAAALANLWHRNGVRVRPRKPVESGVELAVAEPQPRDALTLNHAAGRPDPLYRVCPYPLAAAISPERAAALEGREIDLDQVAYACVAGLEAGDLVLVEGAGGFYSPLVKDGLNADLAERLALPVVLVVEDRLGCINHTLLTLEAIERRGLEPVAVVLNRCRPHASGMDNAADLGARLGERLLVVPETDTRGGDAWTRLPGEPLEALAARLG